MDHSRRYAFVQRQLCHTLSKLQRSLQESRDLTPVHFDRLANWRLSWERRRQQISRRLEMIEATLDGNRPTVLALPALSVVGLPEECEPVAAAC